MAEKTFHSITLPGQDTARVPLTAAEFSTSVAYKVKDYCTYQGKLYRCTTAHAAGAWNAAHFTVTDVDAEFDRKLDIPASQATAPANPRVGDLWIDNDENSPIYNVDASPTLNSTNAVQSGGTKVALNSLDSRKMEHGVITGDFSASVDYRVGDLVFYATTANGIITRTLYRCITDHNSVAWNAAHFTATTLEVELQRVRDNEADTDMIGDLFGTKTTYAVGDYCIYNDNLYRCVQAVDNTGVATPAFDPDDWTQVALANDVSDLITATTAVGNKLRTIIKEDVVWSTPANGRIGDNGAWRDDSAWISSHTNKLYCEEGWKYAVKGGSYNNSLAPVVFYYNGTTLVSVSTDGHALNTEREYTVPSGIDGVIFQVANTTSGGLPTQYYANQLSPLTVADVMGASGKSGQVWAKGENDAGWSNIDSYIENKADQSNLPLPISESTVGYINNNGVINANAGWHCVYTDRIECKPGWKFRYQGGTYNSIANSILFFLNGMAVSQIRYGLNSDVEITVPDGVNEVIFQTANAKSGDINLTVTRLYPYALNDAINQLEGISAEVDGLKNNPFYSQFESISIFADETKYAKTYDRTSVNLSPREIPQNTYINKVKFKTATATDGYIVIADKSIYESHLYMRIVAMYPVTSEIGWNEVSIGFNTGNNPNYIIGFYNLEVVYDDYRTLPKTTGDEYRWGNGVKAYYLLTTTTPAVDVWSPVSTYAANFFECYAFTMIAYTGIIPTVQEKNNEAYEYMLTKTQLQDGTLLPKYKVVDGQDYGYVGRWYDWTYNGNAVKVASAAGAEVCFKVKGTTSLTINWTGDNVTEHVYYCYYIDGAQKVRTNVIDNVITLPDTNEHIVRIVCDSIPHGSSVNCWTVGYGWVFGGVNTGNGTLKGIVPTNPTIMYFGDSLTEGVRAYGSESGS